MPDGGEEVQVRIVLQGEMAKKFNLIKRHYGLESNADLVRLLITMEHERIRPYRGS
jgi:hypothetical protein